MMVHRSDDIDVLARAIADPTRRRILDLLRERPGLTTGELGAAAPSLTRFAVIKHLEALRTAGLIRTMSEGRRRRHYLEPSGFEPLRTWLAGR